MIEITELLENKLMVKTSEKEIAIEITPEQVKNIVRENNKGELVKLLTQELKEDLEKESLLDIVFYQETLFEQLEKAYLEYKKKTSGITIRKSEKVPAQELFITEQIHTVNNDFIIIRLSNGKIYIIETKTPKEASELIKRSDIELISFLHNQGINPSEIIEKYSITYPYIHVYRAEGRILFSRIPLRLGTINVRLKIPSRQELEDLFNEIPDNELYEMLVKISKNLAIPMPNARQREEEKGDKFKYISKIDMETIKEELKKQVMDDPRIRFVEIGLSKEEYEQATNNWKNILRELNNNIIQIDPLIETIYKAMSLHYFKPFYMPNLWLVTDTNAGKTTMYKTLVERDPGPIGDVTQVSLVPHFDPKTKTVEQGILHNRTKAIQIEKTETGLAKTEADMINEYLKTGEISRSLIGKTPRTRGTGPIIFTGNHHDEPNKIMGLQTRLLEQFMDNPEALSSRLLLFYKKNTQELKVKDWKKLEEQGEIIRGVIDHPQTINRLRRIWEYNQITQWLEKEEKPIEIPLTEPDGIDLYAKIKQYIKGLSKHYYKPLKALALNRALFDNLDKILLQEPIEDILEEIITKAEEYFDQLREELAMGLQDALNEIIDKDPKKITKIISSLSLNTKRMILAILYYLKKHEYEIKDRIKNNMITDINIIEAIEEHRQEHPQYYGTTTARHIKSEINRKLPALRRTLKNAGVILYKDDNQELFATVYIDVITYYDVEAIQKEILERSKIRVLVKN